MKLHEISNQQDAPELKFWDKDATVYNENYAVSPSLHNEGLAQISRGESVNLPEGLIELKNKSSSDPIAYPNIIQIESAWGLELEGYILENFDKLPDELNTMNISACSVNGRHFIDYLSDSTIDTSVISKVSGFTIDEAIELCGLPIRIKFSNGSWSLTSTGSGSIALSNGGRRVAEPFSTPFDLQEYLVDNNLEDIFS